jgi:hypothetical protein
MLCAQCRHDPAPPCSSTSTGPVPQDRHTTAPSPHGVSVRCAAPSSRSRKAAGSSAPTTSRITSPHHVQTSRRAVRFAGRCAVCAVVEVASSPGDSRDGFERHDPPTAMFTTETQRHREAQTDSTSRSARFVPSLVSCLCASVVESTSLQRKGLEARPHLVHTPRRCPQRIVPES